MPAATALGPPLGGAAIGLFGPVTAIVADAVSYLFSAVAIKVFTAPVWPYDETPGRILLCALTQHGTEPPAPDTHASIWAGRPAL